MRLASLLVGEDGRTLEKLHLGPGAHHEELPSTYWKRQCVVSCEAGEELIGCFVEHVGDDYLVMATDYPHADAAEKFPEHTGGNPTKKAALPETRGGKIRGDTPARLYGIQSPLFCLVSSPSEPGRGHGEGA